MHSDTLISADPDAPARSRIPPGIGLFPAEAEVDRQPAAKGSQPGKQGFPVGP